jgi:hypothetical protein
VIILTTTTEGPEVWVEVGRVAEKIMLIFNKHGMKTSIFVASIEMGSLVNKLKTTVGTDRKPQFLFCGGWIDTPQGHTRRLPLTSLITEK